MFCIIEILCSRERVQNPFQGHMCSKYTESSAKNDTFSKQGYQSYFSSAQSYNNQSLLSESLQYCDSPANDESVSHMHQSLLFKIWK